MPSILHKLYTILPLLAILTTTSAKSPSSNPQLPKWHVGVHPSEYETLYAPADKFTCRDKSKKIAWSAVNDDYCDCKDGSDEPGTSACANADMGWFWCLNTGHEGDWLKSNRVNDGICDCCDGSDEYDTEVKCPNHCVELAAKVRKQREAEQQKLEAGLKEKNVWLEYAANKHVERLELIENLEREVKELEAKQADAQAAKDNAEKANAARSTVDTRKAQFKALRQCPKKLVSAEARIERLITAYEKLYQRYEVVQSSLLDFATEMDALSRDPEFGKTDRVRGVVSKWGSVSSAAHLDRYDSEGTVVSNSEGEEHLEDIQLLREDYDHHDNEYEEIGEVPVEDTTESSETAEEGKNDKPQSSYGSVSASKCFDSSVHILECYAASFSDAYSSVLNVFSRLYDHPVWSRTLDSIPYIGLLVNRSGPSSSPSPAKPADTITGEQSQSEPQSQPDITSNADLTAATELLNTISNQLTDTKSKLDEAHKLQSTDFGEMGVWEKMYKSCVSMSANSYTYEVCFHDKASQKQDGRSTSLGKFDRFGNRANNADDKYRFMYFSNGEYCWNGPARSLEVEFVCGEEVKVLTVTEPAKCEYNMKLSSPAVCQQPKK